MPRQTGPDGPEIGATVFSDPAVKVAVESVITSMMESVMRKVLVTDPFIKRQHRREKPLYAALVPDDIFLGSHFERRFVTPFGKVWEQLVKVVGQAKSGFAATEHEICGRIRQGRLERIHEVLDQLERGSQQGGVAPDWERELAYIRECRDGTLEDVRVICDVFIAESEDERGEMFEIKAPQPNSDQTKVSKEKLLKLYAMDPPQVNGAYFALPYNPYGKREDYDWNFPMRWFDMHSDPCVLIGDGLWDKVGGEGTYEVFVAIVQELGEAYHKRIYEEYLGFSSAPPYSGKF